MSQKTKQLLILFGSWRNFDEIIPQLNLEDYTIVISTWNRKWIGGGAYGLINDYSEDNKLTHEYISKKIPNAKILIHDFDKVGTSGHSTQNMLYHWKSALNEVKYLKHFNKIVFQRFDLLSNLEVLKNYTIEDDCIYIDWLGQNQNRINDWVFILHPNMVNKFISMWPSTLTKLHEKLISFNLEIEEAHIIWYKLFKEQNINIKLLTAEFPKFLYTLIRLPGNEKNTQREYIKHQLDKLNTKGIKFFDMYNELIKNTNYICSEWNRPFWDFNTSSLVIQNKEQIEDYFKVKDNEETNL